MTSILPLGETVSRRTHQVQCGPWAFLTACWPRPGNHGETCTTPWIYKIFHPIWFNSPMCDWTHESTWVFVMQLIGHAPLVTKARRCLQKKNRVTRSQIKHVPPYPDFWHDTTWWRSKHREADKMSLWRPSKGNTIERSEQKEKLLPITLIHARWEVPNFILHNW
jgi:hypothetical protein